MKSRYFIPACSLLMGLLILFSGCSKKLEEHPHTVFTVAYLQTPEGIQNALYSLYTGLQYQFGPEGAVAIETYGTDEFTMGDQPRIGATDHTLGDYTLDATNGAILTPWNRIYPNINMANGIIEWAPKTGLDQNTVTSIIAQARFLRGLYYLLLVKQFGAVPIDLGSGPFKFNQNPFQGFNRLPQDSVLRADYQGMIDDFTYAAQNLPDRRPASAFYPDKAAAYTKLAEVYLLRGFNDSLKQPNDFQNAFNAAMTVINDTSRFGTSLLQDFGQVNAPGNDYNPEIIFAAERVPGNYTADNVSNPSGIGGTAGSDACNDFQPDYTSIPCNGITGNGTKLANTRSIIYGRPIRRFCPTAWLFNTLFADKVNDSRFDNSFRMMWLATNSSTTSPGTIAGDTAFMLAKSIQAFNDSLATGRFIDNHDGSAYTAYNNSVSGKPWTLISPAAFYVIGGTLKYNIYPALKKYDDLNKTNANFPSTRPFPIIKLSETYLLAAEAAYQMGDKNTAANLLNVLRVRAAYRPGLSPAVLAARQASMMITPAQVNEDFILDERARELCGESKRWSDLARRHDENGMNELLKRIPAFNPDGANIKPYMVLRPIPQSQLDASSAIPPSEIKKYQNPGW
ncbi:RagB/SusD family nutrient uptake outer membrane protein [Thermoflavifilum thermophilum]|uniref:Starch-binding associating with outer membrane n=1 Tax=Thermoflavifilum thermophilum TaxID=1393122 RepID=A0A1I7MYD1_9BACT|nr:RagB/SusD family nutrient uptake outer membrane protein [Thermoflavifilum thermophilum]SFV27439.1 Starch-binding associating with outer membrane [Thermoflavifilum thermophilum]